MYDLPPPEPPTVQWCTTTTNFPTHQIWEQCQEIIKNDPNHIRQKEIFKMIEEVCVMIAQIRQRTNPLIQTNTIEITIDGNQKMECHDVSKMQANNIRRIVSF